MLSTRFRPFFAASFRACYHIQCVHLCTSHSSAFLDGALVFELALLCHVAVLGFLSTFIVPLAAL